MVLEVGLALERYRSAKGSYPTALADLAPDFIKGGPAHVFTGKPLLYRPEPSGALIYSVGKNLKDDGASKTARLTRTTSIGPPAQPPSVNSPHPHPSPASMSRDH